MAALRLTCSLCNQSVDVLERIIVVTSTGAWITSMLEDPTINDQHTVVHYECFRTRAGHLLTFPAQYPYSQN